MVTFQKRGWLVRGWFIVLFAIAGVVFLLVSHAATPYVSINAASGSVASPAVVQACPGSSDGNCVQFGTKSTVSTPKIQLFQFDSSPSDLDAGPNGNLGAIWHGTPLVNDPDVSGGIIVAEWIDLEPTEGNINFSAIDQAMAPWIAVHKKVAIRVMTDAEGDASTPSWVTNAVVDEPAAEHSGVAPVFWNADFLSAYNQFILALAAHYDGNPNVAWIQAGLALDGEGNIESSASYLPSLWDPEGFTDTLWNNTVEQIVEMYTSAFKKTPIAVVPGQICQDSTPSVCQDTSVNQLSSLGVWLQDDGLKSTTTHSDANWNTNTLIEEQLQATSVTGDSFTGEVNAAINAKATYLLAFSSDITNPSNRPILDEVTQ